VSQLQGDLVVAERNQTEIGEAGVAIRVNQDVGLTSGDH